MLFLRCLLHRVLWQALSCTCRDGKPVKTGHAVIVDVPVDPLRLCQDRVTACIGAKWVVWTCAVHALHEQFV